MRNSFFCADNMRACYVHFSMSFRIELSCMSLYPLLLRHGSLMFSLFRLPVSFLNSDFSLLFFDLCFSDPFFQILDFSDSGFLFFSSVHFFPFSNFCFCLSISDFFVSLISGFLHACFFRVPVWTGKSHETDAETAL